MLARLSETVLWGVLHRCACGRSWVVSDMLADGRRRYRCSRCLERDHVEARLAR